VNKQDFPILASDYGQYDPDSLERGRTAFIALANRLSPDSNRLLNAELEFLKNFGAGLETGLGLDEALILAAKTPPPVEARGKRSPSCQDKYETRNHLLKEAYDCLSGEP
jgi:hypothetical protein